MLVTFPPAIGGDGSSVSDDASATTGLANGGHRTRFVPALAQIVAIAQFMVTAAGNQTNGIFTPCRLMTTANDTLNGLAARDGVTPAAGDFVFVRAQTTGSQNGIYVAAAGAWARASFANTSALWVPGKLIAVSEGTAGANTTWLVSNNAPITLGTTALTFQQLPSLAAGNTWAAIQTFSAGATFGGALNMSGAAINEVQGANVASAATINLDTATGNLIDVTGSNAITAITLAQGRERTVRFTGVLTLGGANLLVPPSVAGGTTKTTAAGDIAVFRGYAAGVVVCVNYFSVAAMPMLLSGGTLFGALNEMKGADIASAATINLDAATGNFVHVTGFVNITAVTLAAGARRTVIFDGVLSISPSATLILPAAGNLTINAGDVAVFVGDSAGVVRMVSLVRAGGRELTQLASQNSTSGTTIDFTGIPSWATRITVIFSGVSVTGTSPLLVQMNGVAGLETSQYVGGSTQVDTAIANSTYSAGFTVGDASTAAQAYNGHMVITKLAAGGTGSAGTIVESHVLNSGPGAFTHIGGGTHAMGSTINGLRITTVNGTDSFDAGFVDVIYE